MRFACSEKTSAYRPRNTLPITASQRIVAPDYIYNPNDMNNWIEKAVDLGTTADGDHLWAGSITTPEGTLTCKGAYNQYTGWITEFPI